MINLRDSIKNKKRWVVKVGSALLTNDGQSLDVGFIKRLAEQIVVLREQQIEIVLVSSGSIAAGMTQLGMDARPIRINELQAAAAVGQASLVRSYEEAFKPFKVNTAQVLLTHADIANRGRYLNAKNTLNTLLDLGVLTVINENDTVANEEICFGDNDSLGALVANLIEADLLVILTDQDGLFTADPRTDLQAELLHQVAANDETLMEMASGSGKLGRGGMLTKLSAAQMASRSGASTVIASGREDRVLPRIFNGELLGTLLVANDERVTSKKQWMADQMKIAGSVTLDAGAVKVLCQEGKSLLPVGVQAVDGGFKRGELISCRSPQGREVARGLSNYDASEIDIIKGQSSEKFIDLLGYGGDAELIHRNNLVVT